MCFTQIFLPFTRVFGLPTAVVPELPWQILCVTVAAGSKYVIVTNLILKPKIYNGLYCEKHIILYCKPIHTIGVLINT